MRWQGPAWLSWGVAIAGVPPPSRGTRARPLGLGRRCSSPLDVVSSRRTDHRFGHLAEFRDGFPRVRASIAAEVRRPLDCGAEPRCGKLPVDLLPRRSRRSRWMPPAWLRIGEPIREESHWSEPSVLCRSCAMCNSTDSVVPCLPRCAVLGVPSSVTVHALCGHAPSTRSGTSARWDALALRVVAVLNPCCKDRQSFAMPSATRRELRVTEESPLGIELIGARRSGESAGCELRPWSATTTPARTSAGSLARRVRARTVPADLRESQHAESRLARTHRRRSRA